MRRSHLLEDSFNAFQNLTRQQDYRKVFRFEFHNEPALDAGGVAREWVQLVTEGIFDVNTGLWRYSSGNNVCYQINEHSALANGELHLEYFRFAGKVLGKALFDGQTSAAHLVRVLYKHLVAYPVGLFDLESSDPQLHKSLVQVRDMPPEQVSFQFSVFSFGFSYAPLGSGFGCPRTLSRQLSCAHMR